MGGSADCRWLILGAAWIDEQRRYCGSSARQAGMRRRRDGERHGRCRLRSGRKSLVVLRRKCRFAELLVNWDEPRRPSAAKSPAMVGVMAIAPRLRMRRPGDGHADLSCAGWRD